MIVYLVLCFVVGIILGILFSRKKSDGDLIVYIPDHPEEPPYLSSEWNQPIPAIMAKKSVNLNVVVVPLHTQK